MFLVSCLWQNNCFGRVDVSYTITDLAFVSGTEIWSCTSLIALESSCPNNNYIL